MINAQDLSEKQNEWKSVHNEEMTAEANKFIEEKINPLIKNIVSRKDHEVKRVTFDAPFGKVADYILEILTDYGYDVRPTHDGGGMKSIWIVSWK